MQHIDLTTLQNEVREWSCRNFGDGPAHRPLLGAMEELGELCHAHLKQEQGIRGSAAQHEAAAQDAVADIVIYLADYCGKRGFDFGELVTATWQKVCQRDWTANPRTGDAE